MTTLILKRKKDGIGLLQSLRVVIDGKFSAILKYGSCVEVLVSQGWHSVSLIDDERGNYEFEVEVMEGLSNVYVLSGHRKFSTINLCIIGALFAASFADHILFNGYSFNTLLLYNSMAIMFFFFFPERMMHTRIEDKQGV